LNSENYQRARIAHWDAVACQMDHWSGWGGGYHRRLERVFRFLVPPGQRVLEVGCGRGDLLAALSPAQGVGIDFSPEMLARARQRHPDLTFIQADAHDLSGLDGPFDFILLSDLVNDVWDVQQVLENLPRLCHPHTRLLLNTYSLLWELPLALAGKLGLAKPTLKQNWLTPADITNLLRLAGFELIRRWPEVLFPLGIPLLAGLCNRWLVRLWPFDQLALTNFLLARPCAAGGAAGAAPRLSVIIPARNEAGNIPRIFTDMPELGGGTELVFVEGHSRDDTYAVIQSQIAAHPERSCQLFRQAGEGKGDAVRLGLAHARGEALVIFDADLTVPFEDLPRFFKALCGGQGEFINGVRLVYPMEDEAMRLFNLWGNKFFSLVFSYLLGQPIKDTLCGTKMFWQRDYATIAANRSYFGDFDPFGDYDLIFGAAKLGLRIVDLPVRYQARTYGTTNIQRWKHGWLLLRMVMIAAARLKFV
jgi:SAM-dependent methyltransferase